MEKWPFQDQNHGLTPLGKYQFFDFLDFLFLEPRKAFFRSRISEKTFSWPILPKKKIGKMAIFGPKPWENVNFLTFWTSWNNVNFSIFWTSCFYSLEKRFFVLEYHKRHFPGLYCLKMKVGKMAVFGPKSWVNPFGKMSIFRLFGFLVFIAQKGVFLFQNVIKEIFLAYIPPQKFWTNVHFWTKTIQNN